MTALSCDCFTVKTYLSFHSQTLKKRLVHNYVDKRQRDRETEITEIKKDRMTEWQKDRKNRKTERQKDRKKEGQIERKSEGQIERNSERTEKHKRREKRRFLWRWWNWKDRFNRSYSLRIVKDLADENQAEPLKPNLLKQYFFTWKVEIYLHRILLVSVTILFK